MGATPLFFYLFSSVLIASALMVIASKNPVHSVLFLILAFVNAAGLFLLLEAEFLAMILVVVYVGAVAVLFLFVVMMLDVDFAELRQGFLKYVTVGALVGVIVVVELGFVVGSYTIGQGSARSGGEPGAGAAQHGGARQHHLHPVLRAVPGGRTGAADGDDRRHRAHAAPQALGQATIDP